MTTWTPREHARLETLREAGHTYAGIARHLNRSLWSVKQKAVRRAVGVDGMDANTVAAVFGVERRVVARWIAHDWLQAVRCGNTNIVTEEAVEHFVAGYQCLYDARRITDAYLRDYARSLPPSPWRTVQQMATTQRVSEKVVRRWIRKGRVVAVRGWRGMWWIRDAPPRARSGKATR